MAKDRLSEQGLPNLTEQWVAIRYLNNRKVQKEQHDELEPPDAVPHVRWFLEWRLESATYPTHRPTAR